MRTLACVLTRNRLVRMNLVTGEESRLPEVPGARIIDARPSWDDRWLAVLAGQPDGRALILSGHVDNQRWVTVAEDARALACPRWSSDGSLLYYVSQRDDHICLWAHRLDPLTRKPLGEPLPVYHMHTTSSSFMLFAPGLRVMDVARDKIILPLPEVTGNLWSTTLGEQ